MPTRPPLYIRLMLPSPRNLHRLPDPSPGPVRSLKGSERPDIGMVCVGCDRRVRPRRRLQVRRLLVHLVWRSAAQPAREGRSGVYGQSGRTLGPVSLGDVDVSVLCGDSLHGLRVSAAQEADVSGNRGTGTGLRGGVGERLRARHAWPGPGLHSHRSPSGLQRRRRHAHHGRGRSRRGVAHP